LRVVGKKTRQKENKKEDALGPVEDEVIDSRHNCSACTAAYITTDGKELKVTSLHDAWRKNREDRLSFLGGKEAKICRTLLLARGRVFFRSATASEV
jgi:hypothetical protein